MNLSMNIFVQLLRQVVFVVVLVLLVAVVEDDHKQQQVSWAVVWSRVEVEAMDGPHWFGQMTLVVVEGEGLDSAEVLVAVDEH